MSSNFDEMWKDALASFYATTDRKLDDASLPLITSLDDFKLELDRRQENFAEYRKKRHALVCHQAYLFPIFSLQYRFEEQTLILIFPV